MKNFYYSMKLMALNFLQWTAMVEANDPEPAPSAFDVMLLCAVSRVVLS